MLQMEFTAQECDQLYHETFYNPDPEVRKRCATVYCKALALPHKDIGTFVRVSQPTVRRHLKAYQAGGLAQLTKVNRYTPTSELAAHRTALTAEFQAHPPQTVNEAAERIEQKTGLRRSPTQVRQFLKSLGMKRLKVGHIPAKADPAQHAAFLEEKLQPRLAEAQQGQRHVFFMDAAHFVRMPFVGFLWCFARVFIPALSGRQRLNVLGALHATTHQLVTVINEDYVNAETVMTLLRQMAARFADLPITIVLDNARYQHCRLVMEEAAALGIELLFLPPYSPNLNLIERLWKFVKKSAYTPKYYETFALFKAAIVGCLAEASGKHKPKLASLLTLNFQTFENESL
jgi:transposase